MKKPILVILLSLGFLVAIVCVNWLTFRYLADQEYFIWYLKNGALIGILVSFIGLIWDGLDYRKELLSAHPGEYLHGCFALLAIFYWSVTIHLERIPQSESNASKHDLPSKLSFPLDRLISVIIVIVMGVFALAWLIIVAPLNYFVIILSGAIARQELQGECPRAIVFLDVSEDPTQQEMQEENPHTITFKDAIDKQLVRLTPPPQILGKTVLTSTLLEKKLPDNMIDISLAQKPFAVTQAITAFILYIGKILLIG